VVDLDDKKKVPGEPLLKGRRALEFIEGITLIDDLKWNKSIEKWILHCSLFSKEINEDVIPTSTDWYIVIDNEYPRGPIGFFPSKINSITKTFPHQLYNKEGSKEKPWRDGLLCLDANVRSLGRIGSNAEPIEADFRLAWFVERALHWLKVASVNELTFKDEPFELVDFPERSPLKVGFLEDFQSFRYWNYTDAKYGHIDLFIILPGSLLVRNFKKLNGQCVRKVTWGNYASQFKNHSKLSGSWILLNEIPHIKPWQAPSTWAELHDICTDQGIDLKKIMGLLTNKQIHRNKITHIMLVGFPVKDRLNDNYSEIFWKGIEIPIPFRLDRVIKNHFRKQNENFYINKQWEIKWMDSFNWSKESVMSRGIQPKTIASSKILQIGAGSLGSSVAELLIRSGVEKMGIIDYDSLEMGNITRHTLLINEIGQNKAKVLVHRLNQTSVHSKACAFPGTLQMNLANNSEQLEKYNVILDCTGDDDVLTDLYSYKWSTPRKFISISLGYGGKRLFIFSCIDVHFPNDIFRKMIDPWLRMEKKEDQEEAFPREGLGCWHPLFPARIDDVWLMAATAVKKLEDIYKQKHSPFLSVYEQEIKNGVFQGLRLVEDEVYNG
jgi:molybdopterin/thiamine biosynthesis adenylyltransferase